MLNHWFVVGLSSFQLTPGTIFGRSELLIVLDWFTPATMSTGNPVDFATIELICQPPKMLLPIPPLLRNGLPLPIGNSYNTDETKRCLESKSERPYSHFMQLPICSVRMVCAPFCGLVPLLSSSDFEKVYPASKERPLVSRWVSLTVPEL